MFGIDLSRADREKWVWPISDRPKQIFWGPGPQKWVGCAKFVIIERDAPNINGYNWLK